jgi:hypothetical protein
MKKLIIFLFALLIVLLVNKVHAQSDIAGPTGHTGTGNYYVGWDNTTTIPLNVMHQGAHSIKFFTNNLHRMIIDSTNGYVGMGLNFMAPQSLLHIDATNNNTGEVFRTDCPGANSTFWRMFRDGNQQGRLFNLSTDNHLRLEASVNDLILNKIKFIAICSS